MRTRVIFYCIFLGVILSTLPSNAQITYQYEDKNGMPSSWVYAATQNTDGLIYLATDNGLCIFNGFEFNVIATKNRDIINCFPDSKGRIWFINSSAQLFFYDKGKVFSHEQINAISEKHSSLISRDLSFNDKLYITHGNNIDMYDVNTLEVTRFSFPEIHIVRSIWTDGKDVFITDGSTINILRGSKLVPLTTKKKNFLIYHGVYYRGLHYLSTSEGIMNHDGTNFFPFLEKNFHSQDWSDFKIFLDRGELHLSTYNEVDVLKDGKFVPKITLPSRITSYFGDSYGNTWMSTLGDGLFRIPTGFEKIHRYKSLEGEQSPRKIFYLDLPNFSFFGNDDGTFTLNGKNIRYSQRKQCSVKDMILFEGWIVIATDGGLFQIDELGNYTLVDFSSYKDLLVVGNTLYTAISSGMTSYQLSRDKGVTNPVTMFEDRVYSLTANTHRAYFSSIKGFYKIDANGLTPCLKDEPDIQSSCVKILDLVDGWIIIISGNQFVHLYDTKKDQIVAVDSTLGYFRYNSCLLDPYSNNTFWISTNQGIIEFEADLTHKKIIKKREIAFDISIFNGETKDIQIIGDSLFFLCKNNVYRINKNDVPYSRPLSLDIYSLSSSNVLLDRAKKIVLDPENDNIRIEVFDPSYSSTKYRYRINNDQVPSNWIVMNGNVLNLPKLTPGKYRIDFSEARIHHADAIALSIALHQKGRPLDNQALQFALVLIGVSFIGLFFYNRQRERNKTALLEIELSNTQANLKLIALQSQMNPHFLRNCLNSIQSLIYSNETRKASQFISHFSKLIEQFLHHVQDNFTPLDLELELLENFIKLEQLRFADSFQYHEDIGRDVPMYLEIPTMFIQPLIENAIEHGLLSSDKSDKNLWLIIRFEKPKLKIYIIDDGNGITETSEENKRSIALSNIRNRIQTLNTAGDFRISFEIQNGTKYFGRDVGVEATLEIEYINI